MASVASIPGSPSLPSHDQYTCWVGTPLRMRTRLNLKLHFQFFGIVVHHLIEVPNQQFGLSRFTPPVHDFTSPNNRRFAYRLPHRSCAASFQHHQKGQGESGHLPPAGARMHVSPVLAPPLSYLRDPGQRSAHCFPCNCITINPTSAREICACGVLANSAKSQRAAVPIPTLPYYYLFRYTDRE